MFIRMDISLKSFPLIKVGCVFRVDFITSLCSGILLSQGSLLAVQKDYRPYSRDRTRVGHMYGKHLTLCSISLAQGLFRNYF